MPDPGGCNDNENMTPYSSMTSPRKEHIWHKILEPRISRHFTQENISEKQLNVVGVETLKNIVKFNWLENNLIPYLCVLLFSNKTYQ